MPSPHDIILALLQFIKLQLRLNLSLTKLNNVQINMAKILIEKRSLVKFNII
jgi:hypothetical protein